MTDSRPSGALTSRDDGARFVEYPVGPGALTLRTLADAMTTVALTSVAAFLLAILPLVGVVDERALGSSLHRAVDHWSRVWLGVTLGLGLCVGGAVALACTAAADVATRARLRQEAEQPGAAQRVPVFAQRRVLSSDIYAGVRMASGSVAVLAGVLGGLFVCVVIYMAAQGENDIGAALIATGALLALTVVSLVVYGWSKRRPSWKSKATALWSESAAKIARDEAKEERRKQGRPVPNLSDRTRTLLAGPLAKTLSGLSIAWAAAGIIMVFVRKPGRNASLNHFSEPVEDGIGLIWRVLVVTALALLILGVAAWLLVLAVDVLRLASLARRAARGALLPRPDKAALARAVDVPGAWGMVGRSLIVLATLVGSAALAMLLSDEGPVATRTLLLAIAGIATVLGLLATAAGHSVARGWRAQVRQAWPVADAPVVKEGKRAQRRQGSAGISPNQLL